MAYAKYDTSNVLEALRKLDRTLGNSSVKAKAILVGASALMLKYGLSRKTGDIDICITSLSNVGNLKLHGLGEIFARYGIQLVPEAFLVLHEDYEERLEPVEGLDLKNIELFLLHPYDLAISKIARGFDKDIEDVLQSTLLHHLDIKKLEKLYFEAIEIAVGDKNRYLANWKRFMEELKLRGANLEQRQQRQSDTGLRRSQKTSRHCKR